MYSDTDLDEAVASGALSPEAAAALRAHVAADRATPLADEEQFRLVTGFNDIFVTIAAILLLVAVAWLGGDVLGSLVPPPFLDGTVGGTTDFFRYASARTFGGAAAVALVAWLLAEYFTRRRRMALPSILLLLAFVLGLGFAVAGLLTLIDPMVEDRARALIAAISALTAAAGAWAHWQRFRVPITIAALAVALAGTLVALLLAALPAARDALMPLLLVAGLALFAFAMWWDMADRERRTRRSDVAFWLHLAAAPMIAHPIFQSLGVMEAELGAGRALLVIALYVLFGIVALAIDRRALLVSALFYVLWAISALFRQAGALSLSVALTGLVIGSALLMLSAFWQPIRRRVVAALPADLQARLPAIDRPAVSPRPA